MPGLRLVIYDGTQQRRWFFPGLTRIWAVGARLFRALGWIDLHKSAQSWEEAFRWVALAARPRPIAEIQFWGHGKWGCALIANDVLDANVVKASHPLFPHIEAIRARLLPNQGSVLWFRTCETFGSELGRSFARAWADRLKCRVAGHTYMIGIFQSGLGSLTPEETPAWSGSEGVAKGTAVQPTKARRSSPFAPRTITCLSHKLPRWTFFKTSRSRAGSEP